jgi:hypothetical protein
MLIVSPAIVTSLLAAHLGAAWIALLCLGCLGTVAIAGRLRVTLTADQDLVMQPPVAESPPRAVAVMRHGVSEARTRTD